MDEHPIAQYIIDLLSDTGCWHESFRHEPVRTSEEAAAERENYTLHQGAKAIIVRVKIPNEGKRFVMLVFPADCKFDGAKVKEVLGAKDIRFATEDEVVEITGGVRPGGVPPFGKRFGLQVVCDPSLFGNEKIVFNAGRTTSIGMMSADYKRFVEPVVAEIL
ncbi:MAG TPA: YbaK/EbsC family protein [Spirochaetia bacterium]|nr:YbaK/EbsC family protein [Spirochaetia bacterium]